MTTFVAVVEAGSTIVASEWLDLSPSYLTNILDELETYLDTKLLEKSGRNVRLTEAGRKYFDDCRRILAEIDEAETRTRRASAEYTPRTAGR
jgi:DNA-binding transcriptional LysR family regulator